MSKAIKIITAILFFAIGGLIYVAFRSTSLRMFGWFDYLGLNDCVMAVRRSLCGVHVSAFLRYCVPDALWTLSYILFMDAIWNADVKKQVAICSLIPIVGSISEILQYFHVVNGTFDIVDLLCYSFPYVIYLLFKIL